METILYRVQNINQWTNVLVVILITISWSHMVFGECPHLCECKWKSGKESVLCLNANLSRIPNKLDAGTQVLDLTGNDINAIGNDAFNRANLLNLQKLFLIKCRLKTIERYAFRKLKNLVELDLSYNVLVMIPSLAFDSTPELRELKLIGNPILRILNDAFLKVPQLIRLELSDCKITSIEVRAFVGLEASLEWLKLDGNKLVDIRVKALTSLQNLHGLELATNPWNCSCNLRPLREWMIRENIPYGIPPACRYPQRLAGKSWDKIDLDEYACIPHILAPDIKAHGVEGKNITMSCMVGGVPEPNVRWMIRNRIIANLTGNSMFPAAQGRKMYMVNLQENASNLTILTAEVQDAGTYICAAENKAGKVEASVILAISRKPPDGILSTKIILASIIAIALFIVTSTLAVVCLITLKRRKKLGRWSTQPRCESYEKIELNHKHSNRVGKSPRGDRCNFMKPYGENGIAVVGQGRRNGDYRNVPSEDDGTDCYEENMETSNGIISNMKNENALNWQGAIGISSKTDEWRKNSEQNKPKNVLKAEDTDLHIPRLIEFR